MSAKLQADLGALLKAAQHGDCKAQNLLLGELRPFMWDAANHAIAGKCRHKLEESDLVQDSYLAVVQHFHKFRGDTEKKLLAWLTTIVRHVALDAIRGIVAAKRDYRRENGRPSRWQNQDEAESAAVDPVASAIRRETVITMHRAMRGLSEGDQELITLWMADAGIGEIAEHYGLHPAAAYKRLARGLNRLAELVAVTPAKRE
jgi:RNA polymerase sigma factor (sigma-70 family)